MIAQPLRLGVLALGWAFATATLVLVTVVASSLVLSVVAALGPEAARAQPPERPAVEQVRLASDSDDSRDQGGRDQGRDRDRDRDRQRSGPPRTRP